MAKLWTKVNGTWVSLGAQSKDDVGLGNVENFTFTNSATDGSSSKYATGAAAKQAYDRASVALSRADGKISLGGNQYTRKETMYSTAEIVKVFEEVPGGCVVTGGRRDSQDTGRIRYRRIL